MAKRIKKSDLSEREKYLIALIDEVSCAARLCITPKTLQLWCDFGLPFVWYGRQKFFDWFDVSLWFEAPNSAGEGKNADLVWSKTPDHLLPCIMTVRAGEETEVHVPVAAGKYCLMPLGG